MSRPIELPAKLQPIFSSKARYKVIYGGRGSAKSESIGRVLIVLALQEKCRILCCREFQTSIRESVHALIKAAISAHELDSLFEINHNSIRCKPTGTEFIFSGLADHTVDSIKSMHGVKYVWVEEAHTISKRSFDILLPTIRTEGSQFFFTYNPELETDPVHSRFVKNRDPQDDALVIEMNWNDNPWFPSVLEQERLACKRRSQEDYAHIWEGKTKAFLKASILGHLIRVRSFEVKPNWIPYYGLDWGFSNDPTVCVRCFVQGKTLYISHGFHGYGVEIDEYYQAFTTVPGAHSNKLRADSARPECISYLNNPKNSPTGHPLQVEAAPKWSGSVEDGIAWLRSLDEIILHEALPELWSNELTRYQWKVDKRTGEIQPIPAEGNDHCLVAGSLIQTTKGQIPIEQLKDGEVYCLDQETGTVVVRKFFNVRCTGIKKVLSVTLSDGTRIIGSERHILMGENGWCFLEDMTVGKRVWKVGQSSLTDLDLSKTNNPGITYAPGKSHQSDYIATCGKNISDLFQRAHTSIIKTITKLITTSQISKLLLKKNTLGIIQEQKKEERHQKNPSSKPLPQHHLGTNLTKEDDGIVNTQGMWRQDVKKLIQLVSIVDELIKANSQKSSVQTTANRPQDVPQKQITFLGNVAFVDFNSQRTDIQRPDVAPEHAELLTVICKESIVPQPVYNMEVEDTHNYMDSNGVVHHNCADAIRYACSSFIKKKVTMFDVM